MRRAMLLSLLLLAGCGDAAQPARDPDDRDPAIMAALNEPLLTDPDLTGLNMGGAALTGGGPAIAPIPPDKTGKDEIDAARAAARSVLGAAAEPPPASGEKAAVSRLTRALTAPAIAKALAVGPPACADAVDYSAIWAARLDPPFEVYPRGHVGQSAGTDAGGCRLRVVGFSTPVTAGDVLAFYAARARSGGFPVTRRDEGEDSILTGAKGAVSYAVAVRPAPAQMTEVVVAVSGAPPAATPR